MKRTVQNIGAAVLVALWAGLCLVAWLQPSKAESEAERRKLEQFPQVSTQTVLSGQFMKDFEDYSLDQFPARDTFRKIKSVFHYYALQQKDNNDIYLVQGHAAKLEYPMNEAGVANAAKRFNQIYESYLKDSGSKILFAVVPDKSFYMAEENGYPAMDYDALMETVEQATPWAEHVDLTDQLSIEDYYRTDTHWRQEELLPAAQKLCQALDMTMPEEGEFTKKKLDRPFYGVYYGQAALPMDPESMYVMESSRLAECRVYRFDDDSYAPVYDLEKLTGKDLYDVFLSGPQSLLRIENPNARTDRELLVFRDSFGSSMVPLLVQDYAQVTVVDIRYVPSSMLAQKISFTGQDVLFLYSTTILNTGAALK